MRFGILGTLTCADLGIDLSRRREGRILGALLLSANRPVPTEQLIDMLWPERPPSTALQQVQNCVTSLIRLYAGAAAALPVERIGRGYLLPLAAAELDALAFEQDTHRAAALTASGDDAAAADLLRAALLRWRGEVLLGLDMGPFRPAMVRLEELRLSATEQLCAAELRLGRHREVVADLAAAVARHPAREDLVRYAMTALHAGGRTPEALALFARTRQVLRDELGLDPGAELRELHATILRGSAPTSPPRPTGAEASDGEPPPASVSGHPAPARPATVPAQLPLDAFGFTGRAAELARLDQLCEQGMARGTTTLAVVCGTAGVGKTALVVYWAQRVRDRFPDGQLYANLRGYTAGPPLSTTAAVTNFLVALGVPAEQIPTDLDSATGLYRSLLADRRVLVVLDNARDPNQVRALLPGAAGCLVVVTSRDRLAGLTAVEGAHRLAIDVLPPPDARALLTVFLGADRAADPAVGELAAACAYLPLALRIAAANVQAGPVRPIAHYLAELSRDRISGLAVPGDPQAAVREAFTASLTMLEPADRHAFALLGLVRGGDWTVEVIAALLGADRPTATRTTDRLAAAHLVQEHQLGRYTSHDLLRQYAVEILREQVPAGHARAARARMLDFLLRTCDNAARISSPDGIKLPREEPCEGVEPVEFGAPGAALSWLDTERDNLLAEVVGAADDGPLPFAWQMVDSLRGYFWLRRPAGHWLRATEAGLRAARVAANQEAEAVMANLLGTARWTLGDHAAAILAYQDAVEVNRRAGRRTGEAGALGNLAGVYREMGRLSESARYGQLALDKQRSLGNTRGVANALLNLSGVAVDTGSPRQALDLALDALDCYQSLDISDGIGAALLQTGLAHLAMGDAGRATRLLHRARDIFVTIEAVAGEVNALGLLAEAEYRLGRIESGLEYAATAVALAESLDNAQLTCLAATASGNGHAHRGDLVTARHWYHRALDLPERGQTPQDRIDALLGLADVSRRLEDHDTALRLATNALGAARAAGLRPHEDRAAALVTAVDGLGVGVSGVRSAPADAAP